MFITMLDHSLVTGIVIMKGHSNLLKSIIEGVKNAQNVNIRFISSFC